MKHIKLFEDYKDNDFEIHTSPNAFSMASSDKDGRSTSGKFIGKLTQDDQDLLDELKNMFGDESFKGVKSADYGAIVGSGAGKRNVDSIYFLFQFRPPNTLLYVWSNKDKKDYTITVEHPLNQDDTFSKEFKTKEEVISFLDTLGRLKNFKKSK